MKRHLEVNATGPVVAAVAVVGVESVSQLHCVVGVGGGDEFCRKGSETDNSELSSNFR